MKQVVFLFLLMNGKCLAQYPELLFVKSLGVSGSNSDVQTAYAIDLDTSGNVYSTVSGGSTFNLGLAETPLVISSTNGQSAILARFNEDQFDLGGFGYLATDIMRSDETGLILTALLDSDSELNFSNLPSQNIEVPEGAIR